MQEKILSINSAYNVLLEGLVIVDFLGNRFKLKENNIVVKNVNARYVLKVEEFLTLYKEKKFIVLDDDESGIDSKKDEEYYSFKHK